MERLSKIKLFISLDLKTKLLYLEAYFFLGWACVLLKRPFRKVVPKLGNEMEETLFVTSTEKSLILSLYHVSKVIQIMSRYTFWESKCFVKAIAGMKMLERRNIDSTLYLGTARDESGKMVAHAWLRSGTFYVTGSENMEMFTIVNKFAKYAGVKKCEERNK